MENAVRTAREAGAVFCLGEIIHNKTVVDELERGGLTTIHSLSEAPDGASVIIRSHGTEKNVYAEARARGIKLIDTTCKFVKHIQETAEEFFSRGYQIILAGDKEHPEIKSVNSFCENSAVICGGAASVPDLSPYEKLCILSQTTFSADSFEDIINNIKDSKKTVEIFNTICYTTIARQKEAVDLSRKSDLTVVVGGVNSSNTKKLYEIAKKHCQAVFLIETAEDLYKIDRQYFKKNTAVILAGASTPRSSIMEVFATMEKRVEEKNEFLEAVDNLPDKKTPKLRRGQKIKVSVVSVSDEGIMVNVGRKSEAIIPKDQISAECTPEEALKLYKNGDEIEATILSVEKSPYILSLISRPEPSNRAPRAPRREAPVPAEPDPAIDAIRGGVEFSHTFTETNKGGLIGKYSTYSLFVPASQIKSTYVTNLENYKNKPLRLVATDINDKDRKIVASQKVILEKEKNEKEESFWSGIEVGKVVKGKVLRFTDFGAFVDVNNFDCLAHNTDLGWGAVKQPSEVLAIGNEYDFIILKASREKSRISLGLKQLTENPWEKAAERYPVGATVKGTVIEIKPYGAYIAVEKGLDGLVHVSNLSHEWISSINEKVALGDEIEARVIEVNPETKRLSLSIKALLPIPVQEPKPENKRPAKKEGEKSAPKKDAPKRPADEKEPAAPRNAAPRGAKPSAPRAPRRREDDDLPHEYFSESGGSSIADLLKNLKLDEEN